MIQCSLLSAQSFIVYYGHRHREGTFLNINGRVPLYHLNGCLFVCEGAPETSNKQNYTSLFYRKLGFSPSAKSVLNWQGNFSILVLKLLGFLFLRPKIALLFGS